MSRANEPVFPVARDLSGTMNYGLSVREEFAKAAMQGMLSCDDPDRKEMQLSELARLSVRAADALLAELAKPVTP